MEFIFPLLFAVLTVLYVAVAQRIRELFLEWVALLENWLLPVLRLPRPS